MEKNSKITQQTKVDIATFVHFFTLARNRLPPKPDVDDYVEELYESLSWFKFGDRPDFIFFYVLFDFHGMLPTRPVLTMVFSNWYKSYREAIARELGVSLQANPPAWQQLMAFMRKLPCVIKEAQEKICFYNVMKRIVKGEEERNERIHEEHFRLWAAMRYNVKHWQSLDSLRALLADLPVGICNYEVPLFSQYSSFHQKPKSSTTGTFTKPVVPEEHKFCEMDFIPNCTGIGYNCFHLASFTSRRAAFQFYPKLTGTKRKMSNPPSALVTSKKIRLEPESIPPIVDDVPVNNEAGADDIGDTNVIGNDDTGADSDEIDLFTLSPSHQEMPGSPLYPPSPPTPYRGNFDTIPVFTFISNHPLAEPLVIERSVAQRPSITPSLGLRILANIDTDYRTNSRGQTFLHLRASDCIVRLSEFDKVDSDDMFCYREVTLTRVTLAQTGGSMTRLAVIFFERLTVLHFIDVDSDLVAKLQPVLYNSLRALSIKSISKPLISYGFSTQYAKLQFLHLDLGGPVYQLYKQLGGEVIDDILNKIFALAPRLVGLRLPIPNEDPGCRRVIPWEISLVSVRFPDQFQYLELESHCPEIFIDLRELHRLPLRRLCLRNIFISPIHFFNEGDPHDVNLNIPGPQLFIGGRGLENTYKVMKHIIAHRPFRFHPHTLTPQMIYPPSLFDHEWDIEVAAEVHCLLRKESLDYARFGPMFYPSLIPPLEELTATQREYLPNSARVFTVEDTDSVRKARAEFIKFSL